ncbi:activator of Hsp90 ATPase 1 family protein [Paenibacillus helianthi]|uniref:Activator of Hsp90 ATPase 1 family protein n=1 Tax=Paenibacillus helianthi TaxID=1349432 RepID=A0ABX3EQU3_9BACL|nr:SRPBCC family protein [Paenibacillus helianthi]OKP88283.1 activator of Hsp90 ATPase 1 family protein [Paenibacillus helianthi]
MIATLQASLVGATATFERHYKQPVDKVWAMLTDNALLAKWFPELKAQDLSAGGSMIFDMGDGSSVVMEIMDIKVNSILEYVWGNDSVRFELSPDGDGTRLLLIESISEITSHTAKDLSGWHVCLDVIEALLDGEELQNRKKVWEQWFVEYTRLVEEFRFTRTNRG